MGRKLRIGLVLLSIATFIIAVLIARRGSVESSTLWLEITKTLLQVGVVLVLGALLSTVTSDYQQRHEKAEARLELLRAIMGRAAAAYNDVKRARRLLRAQAMAKEDNGTVVLADAYDEQIVGINDAQLQFETMADEIRGAFPELAESLATEFDTIEEALNSLISEYEDNRRNFTGKPLSIREESLPRLKRFLDNPINVGGASQKVEVSPGFAPVHNAFRDAQRNAWERYLKPGSP